jgi:hypothetical protein
LLAAARRGASIVGAVYSKIRWARI